MRARNLNSNNDYSLKAIERDLLAPSNLKFVRDDSGNIADLSSTRAGSEGSIGVEAVKPEAYTPTLLMQALDAAERVEKDFIKTGQRQLSAGENPRSGDLDFERAEILANLLDGQSLEMLATRGLHGKAAGDRDSKVNAVRDLLYKGSYGRDLYTDAPILGRSQDQGHLESNSQGGTRLRPELSLINQMLGDSEGSKRLELIDGARRRINAAGLYNNEVLEDSDLQRLRKYKDFQNMVSKQNDRAMKYGFSDTRFAGSPEVQDVLQRVTAERDAQAAGAVVGEKPTVINAGEGSRVYVEATENGDGDKAEKIKAILKNGNGKNGKG